MHAIFGLISLTQLLQLGLLLGFSYSNGTSKKELHI
jgi:hypothetical protein